MGEKTKIAWCDSTWNPWRGCCKIASGCQNCYAERQAARNPVVLGHWGLDAHRVIAKESYWRLPYRWDIIAAASSKPHSVFCGSLMDVFEDRSDLEVHRTRALGLASICCHLTWLFVTKRPEVAAEYSQWFADNRHFWLGYSASDQTSLDAGMPHLLRVPGRRFLSLEPLLGPVSFRWASWSKPAVFSDGCTTEGYLDGLRNIHAVIVGGESGPNARPCNVDWIRSIVRQCVAAGVPVMVKQLGAHPMRSDAKGVYRTYTTDRAGADPAEWPEDLRPFAAPIKWS